MKLHHSDDETGVTLSDRDRDVLRAAFDTAEAMRDLADAAGLLGRGTCAECGATARTRPMRVFEDGAPTTAQVCGDCQAEMVEADEAETPEDVAEIDVDVEMSDIEDTYDRSEHGAINCANCGAGPFDTPQEFVGHACGGGE